MDEVNYGGAFTGEQIDEAVNKVLSGDDFSGSSMEIYDDQERVIGTWFGKPLYRKTVSLSVTSGHTAEVMTTDGLTVRNIYGSFYDKNYGYFMPLFYTQVDTNRNIVTNVYPVGNRSTASVRLDSVASDLVLVGEVTVEYTKTTD